MIERLMCALFGHKYVIQLTFSPTSRKVGCTRCKREWAMNDSVRAFVDWSGEFEELYKFNGQWPQPKREWVALTDEEVDDIGCDFATLGGDIESKNWFAFYLAIEAKLKEKNDND
jgi:hypothetical protein